MKNRNSTRCALLFFLAVCVLAVSCSDSSSDSGPGTGPGTSSDALPIYLTGCDFEGATVALVEFFDGGTKVSYGYGNLVNGAASFTLRDSVTDADWSATLGIQYSVYGYCFAGSAGDPVPDSGYWCTYEAKYTQYMESDYVDMSFKGGDFHYY